MGSFIWDDDDTLVGLIQKQQLQCDPTYAKSGEIQM